MLRSAAVARIQQGLGFRSDLESVIIAALKEEQRDLEKGKTLPRFLLVEDASLTLALGGHAVNLPSDFLRRSETLIHYTPYYSEYPKDIPWREYNAARAAYREFNPGGPAVVSLRESTLWFEPEADRAYTLTWTYYGAATVLTNDVENAWLADANMPELLIGGAGLRVAKDVRNAEAIKLFSEMQAMARRSLFGDIVIEEANDVGPMGGDN